MKRFIAEHSALFILAALCVALGLYSPEFRSAGNLQNVAQRTTVVGVIALGELLVILMGGIDLSVGSIAALSGVAGCLAMLQCQTWLASELVHGCVAKLASWTSPSAEAFLANGVFPGLVLTAGLLAGVLVGLACGVVNGLLVTKGRIQPFIATLGMMMAARGLTMVISGQKSVFGMPKLFTWLGGAGEMADGGRAWFVPVLITAVLGLVFALMLLYTQFGRGLYAVGGNTEAARLSGIPVDAVRGAAFAIAGAMAGFAGMILASRASVASPTGGEMAELDAIAACVIGGASLSGGVGGAVAALAGALIMSVLYNFCNIQNVSPDWQKVLVGALLVSLVYYDNWRRRRAGILKD